MVVLIGLNASLSVFYVKIELIKLFQNELINRNAMIAHNYSTVHRNIVHLFTPLMIENLLDAVSLCRVYI